MVLLLLNAGTSGNAARVVLRHLELGSTSLDQAAVLRRLDRDLFHPAPRRIERIFCVGNSARPAPGLEPAPQADAQLRSVAIKVQRLILDDGFEVAQNRLHIARGNRRRGDLARCKATLRDDK